MRKIRTLAEDIRREGGQESGGNYIVRRFTVLCSSDIISETQSRQSGGGEKGGRREGALLITGIKLGTAKNMGNLLTI